MSRLVVIDGFIGADELAAANACWPALSWPGWVNYLEQGGKRGSDLFTPLPVPLSVLLAKMAALNIPARLGIPDSVADLSLRGGGLHVLPPGSGLGAHRDADTHARLGLARAWSAILFVHDDWKPAWYGQLWIEGQPDIEPVPGRLVAFGGDITHGVRPVHCPLDRERRSLALFGFLPQPGGNKRPRAVFE